MPKILIVSASLFTALAAAVYFWLHVNVSWTEEVLFDDGARIVLERTAKGNKQMEIGGPGGWSVTSMTLSQKRGDEKHPMPDWEGPYTPLLLLPRQNGEWYLVATFGMCSEWYAMGRPNSPYIAYETANHKWRRAALDNAAVGLKSNLLVDVNADGEWAYLTTSTKLQRNKRLQGRVREIVSDWKPYC